MLYTTQEIADIVGISKSTARRYLKKIGAVPIHGPSQDGAKVNQYKDQVLSDIQKIIGSHVNQGGAPDDTVIESLLKQLEAKDKQIEELLKALDQEQKLHAMAENKIIQLESHPKEAPQERKSFWSRFRDAVRG